MVSAAGRVWHTVRMGRTVTAVICVLALVGPASAGALDRGRQTAWAPTPVVRVLKLAPTVVRGTGFRRGEKVAVSFTSATAHLVIRTTASPSGAFTVSFARPLIKRCEAYAISAKGALGTRAVLRPPLPMCLPERAGGSTS